MKERGKFIVIYGANNIGKSTQVELLNERLKEEGIFSRRLKYPIYDLEPTGPRINAALREGLNLTDEKLQEEFAQNRQDFEPQLLQMLASGLYIVAEDYKGTGIAWGMTRGVSLERMEEMNLGLLPEDLCILLDGERYTSGVERKHRHEVDSDWERARSVHLGLAVRYGWEIVSANSSREKVQEKVWNVVEIRLLKSLNI